MTNQLTTVSDAHELALGIDKSQLKAMQRKIDQLERENDAIALTRIRHAVNSRLVEIRLLLRDGHLQNMNGGKSSLTSKL